MNQFLERPGKGTIGDLEKASQQIAERNRQEEEFADAITADMESDAPTVLASKPEIQPLEEVEGWAEGNGPEDAPTVVETEVNRESAGRELRERVSAEIQDVLMQKTEQLAVRVQEVGPSMASTADRMIGRGIELAEWTMMAGNEVAASAEFAGQLPEMVKDEIEEAIADKLINPMVEAGLALGKDIDTAVKEGKMDVQKMGKDVETSMKMLNALGIEAVRQSKERIANAKDGLYTRALEALFTLGGRLAERQRQAMVEQNKENNRLEQLINLAVSRI